MCFPCISLSAPAATLACLCVICPAGPTSHCSKRPPDLAAHVSLLVRRTPHNGMRVFRVWRDDVYLSAMLQILSRLATDHVAAGRAPAGAAFASLPGQSQLLSKTNEIARGAEVVAAPGCGGGGEGDAALVLPPACADGSNAAAFWS